MGELTPLSIDDYDAIAAAVEETGRGRWFLSEFARRNRAADTRTVLEALSGLERRLETRGSVSTKAVGLVEQALRSVRTARAVGADEPTGLAEAESALISALQALGGDCPTVSGDQAEAVQIHAVEIAVADVQARASLALTAPEPDDEAAWVDLDEFEDKLMEADDEILTPRETAMVHVNGAAVVFAAPNDDNWAVAADALESPLFLGVEAAAVPGTTINGHASSATDAFGRPKLPVAHTPRLLESLSEAEKAILFA